MIEFVIGAITLLVGVVFGFAFGSAARRERDERDA